MQAPPTFARYRSASIDLTSGGERDFVPLGPNLYFGQVTVRLGWCHEVLPHAVCATLREREPTPANGHSSNHMGVVGGHSLHLERRREAHANSAIRKTKIVSL